MRRNTLASLSPSQLNSRGRPPPRAGGPKQPRVSLPHAPRPNGRSSLSHRASMHGRAGTQARADPRPIGDKNFQMECVKTLMSYLTTHGYTAVVSQKLLASPTQKEITGIILFLFKQVDVNVKMTKLEEDVHAMFKRLGYPFVINKSALYAAGSPQTWPGLLAALTWLVNLLVYEERANEEDLQGQEFDAGGEPLGGDRGGRALFESAAQSYAYFLQGMDEQCEALEAAFQDHFLQECEALAEEQEKAELELLQQEEKLQELQVDPQDVLKAEKTDLAADIEKLIAVVNSFQDHTVACAKKVEEKKADLGAKQAERTAVERENASLKERVDAQQVKSVDYELMAKDSQLLGLNLQAVQAEIEEVKKTEWDCEVQLSRKLKDVEAAVTTFNELARRLQFTVSEGDGEFELIVNPRADKVTEIILEDLKGTVKPKIKELKSLSEKNMVADQEERLAIQKQLYEGNKAKQELLDKIAAQESQHHKLEAKCNAIKEKLEADLSTTAEEQEALLQNVASAEQRLKSLQDQVQRRIADYNEKIKAMNEELKRDCNERFQIVEMCMSHKEYVSSALKRYISSADSVADDLKSASQWRRPLHSD